MKRINILLLLSLFISLVSAARVTVGIWDYYYQPDPVQITQHDTIIWTNQSSYYPHTSTSGDSGVPNGLWDSGNLNPGQSFSHAFPNSGTFRYYCQYHWMLGLRGSVIVTPAGIEEIKSPMNNSNVRLEINTNPFSSSTKITYLVNSLGTSTLKIYDVLGNQIRTFDLNSTKAGWHSITWDGKDDKHQTVTKGIYFCRINSENKEITRKLIKLQ